MVLSINLDRPNTAFEDTSNKLATVISTAGLDEMNTFYALSALLGNQFGSVLNYFV